MTMTIGGSETADRRWLVVAAILVTGAMVARGVVSVQESPLALGASTVRLVGPLYYYLLAIPYGQRRSGRGRPRASRTTARTSATSRCRSTSPPRSEPARTVAFEVIGADGDFDVDVYELGTVDPKAFGQ